MSANAAVERERKFLPDPQSPELFEAIDACTPEQRVAIRQGYVLRAGDEGELRLRETIRAGTERRVMTIKRGAMPERMETEIELSAVQWNQLRPHITGTEIRKERFLVELDSADTGGTARREDSRHRVVVEIDRFEAPHPGLVLIEVEFPSAEAYAAFVPPQWFGREVTGEPQYRNQHLAEGVSAHRRS